MSSSPDPMHSVVQRNVGICHVQQYALSLGKRTTICQYWQKKLSPKSDRVRGEGRGVRGEG